MRHIFHSRNLHFGAFFPNGHHRQQRLGLGVRVRCRGRWRQASIYLSWLRRDLRHGRAMFMVEAKTWLSVRPSGKGSGVPGSKSFVRLKVGLGGDIHPGRERRAFEKRSAPVGHRRAA